MDAINPTPAEVAAQPSEPLNYERPAGADSVLSLVPLIVAFALLGMGLITLLVTLGMIIGNDTGIQRHHDQEIIAAVALVSLVCAVGLVVSGLLLLFRSLWRYR